MFRPSRRPLLWVVPVAVLTLFLQVKTFGDPLMAPIAGFLFAFPVFLSVLALKLVFGRTEAGPEGLRNRLVMRTRTRAWHDIAMLVVVPTLFGRIVQVVGTDRKRFSLAAPRDGLLARGPGLDLTLAVMRAVAPVKPPVSRSGQGAVRIIWWAGLAMFVTFAAATARPWLAPWWPGRAEAQSLPRACSADAAVVRRLVPGGAAGPDTGSHRGYRYFAVSRCGFDGGGAALDLELRLQRQTVGESGTENARAEFAGTKQIRTSMRSGQGVTSIPVAGLGDEAWLEAWTVGRDASVSLLVRRANVLIDIRYRAGRSRAEAVTGATALARTVLKQVEAHVS